MRAASPPVPEVAAPTGVGWFFVFACGISWLVWAPLAVSGLGWSDAKPTPYLHLLGGLGPACAAFALGGGRRGFQRDRRALALIAGSAVAPVVIIGLGILFFAATGQWIEIDILDNDNIVLTAYNITPDGEEAKATETRYARAA